MVSIISSIYFYCWPNFQELTKFVMIVTLFIMALLQQYWSQHWDQYHIDLNHDEFKLSITTTTHEFFWTNFESFWRTLDSAFCQFLHIRIRIFFKSLSPSHKPPSSLSFIYFQTLILRRLTHLPLWFKTQELQNLIRVFLPKVECYP